jgi:hypothetical protein
VRLSERSKNHHDGLGRGDYGLLAFASSHHVSLCLLLLWRLQLLVQFVSLAHGRPPRGLSGYRTS